MQRLVSHSIIESQPRSPQRLAINAAAVGGLHVALVCALISGLHVNVARFIPPDFVARVLPTENTPPPLPQPPQPTFLDQDFAPIPPVKFEVLPDNPITVAHIEHPPRLTQPPPEPVAPTAVVSLMGTHSTPPYPPLSRRLGEEGVVGLRIRIADDGRVSDVEVVKSSGTERLDDAAKEWVLANWRYRAATRDGKPVASETQAVVVFNLKTARH